MSAYLDLNDVPATGNRFLLRDVLRTEWGFRGFVVSDAFSVRDLVTHGFARDAKDAAFRAFTAGLNMDMASGAFAEHLGALVKEGRISTAAIDAAVRPILAAKIRLGLFENPYADEARAQQVINTPEHKQLARLAAQQSIVLLRNENQTLPLRKDLGSIAVIGPLADSKPDTDGAWTIMGKPSQAVTVLEGIRNKLGSGVRVEFAKGPNLKRDIPSMFDLFSGAAQVPPQTPAEIEEAFSRAVETARACDVVVMVLGELANMSGEAASRATLDLPGKQQQILEAVVALGKPVVLVLLNGRPLDISWAAEHVPAILEAWYPGAEGGNAVADVLFGDANPGGKLPVTWPRGVGQLPMYHAHNLTHMPETSRMFRSRYWDQPSSPLYPFGFGLSYTTFSLANLQVAPSQAKLGEPVGVSVEVENTGTRAGDEVVQLYLHQQAGSASRPVRELKGFERVSLTPGEKKPVRFTLGKKERSYWSGVHKKWIEEPENFDVWVGADSAATLHAGFKLNP